MCKHEKNKRANGKRLPILRFGKCFKCRKYTFFTRKRALLCKECTYNASFSRDMTHVTKDRESLEYKMKRKKIIEQQKWCQLCGSTENLTAHHVGGRNDLGLVCLCHECHQAYEIWRQRKDARVIKD